MLIHSRRHTPARVAARSAPTSLHWELHHRAILLASNSSSPGERAIDWPMPLDIYENIQWFRILGNILIIMLTIVQFYRFGIYIYMNQYGYTSYTVFTYQLIQNSLKVGIQYDYEYTLFKNPSRFASCLLLWSGSHYLSKSIFILSSRKKVWQLKLMNDLREYLEWWKHLILYDSSIVLR